MAGGRNIFGDVDKEVVQPSLEEIIQRAPDVIIETLPAQIANGEREQRLSDWKKLAKLPAVQKNRVYIVNEDYMLVPGPRLDLAAKKFGNSFNRRDRNIRHSIFVGSHSSTKEGRSPSLMTNDY
jgi:iron complex transport system substrate-binding protein